MSFKSVFIAHVPDANPEKHRCVVETDKYKLFSVLVRNQNQTLEVCKRLVQEEGIHSIILCPGFTHKDIAESQRSPDYFGAEISEAVGKNISISVARGDGPGIPTSLSGQEAMKREGWF